MGSGNSAANAANAANQQQQQQIQQSVGQINSAFSNPNRQAQIDQYGQNLNNYYTGQVNQQEGINARNLKFANARSGLTGGSAAVDSNTQLQKDYTQGLLQASRQAQAGTSALQQADINSKNQLIGLAQQGNFTGAIPTQMAQANASQSRRGAELRQCELVGQPVCGNGGDLSERADGRGESLGAENAVRRSLWQYKHGRR